MVHNKNATIGRKVETPLPKARSSEESHQARCVLLFSLAAIGHRWAVQRQERAFIFDTA